MSAEVSDTRRRISFTDWVRNAIPPSRRRGASRNAFAAGAMRAFTGRKMLSVTYQVEWLQRLEFIGFDLAEKTLVNGIVVVTCDCCGCAFPEFLACPEAFS